MRTIIFTTLLCYSLLFSQTQDTVKNFMPLAIGNEYQYLGTNNPNFKPFGVIQKDTVVDNGHRYYFRIGLPFSGLIRRDSSGNIWSIAFFWIPDINDREERLIIDINKELWESWTIYEDPFNPILGRCTFDGYLIVFGEQRNVRAYQIYDEGYVYVTYLFAEGIGLIQEIYDDNSGGYLNYAKINGKIYGEIVNVDNKDSILPIEFHVSQNYPNPFNGITNIEIELNQQGRTVRLILFDVLGREIINEDHFINQRKVLQINTDLYNLPSGTYFYRISSEKAQVTKKLMLIK